MYYLNKVNITGQLIMALKFHPKVYTKYNPFHNFPYTTYRDSLNNTDITTNTNSNSTTR